MNEITAAQPREYVRLCAGQENQARSIYNTVMRFLEGKYQSNTGALQDLLEIPVTGPLPYAAAADAGPVNVRTLKFRRVVIMGQSMTSHSPASYAQSVDREDLKIYYDPNWDAVDKLVELLNK